MAVHLARTGKLNGQRKARFPDQYVDDIVALHTTITKDIVDRYLRVRIGALPGSKGVMRGIVWV